MHPSRVRNDIALTKEKELINSPEYYIFILNMFSVDIIQQTYFKNRKKQNLLIRPIYESRRNYFLIFFSFGAAQSDLIRFWEIPRHIIFPLWRFLMFAGGSVTCCAVRAEMKLCFPTVPGGKTDRAHLSRAAPHVQYRLSLTPVPILGSTALCFYWSTVLFFFNST